jgi:hypothetical protein
MVCHLRTQRLGAFADARVRSGALFAVCVVLAFLGEAFGDGPSGSSAKLGAAVDFARDVQPLLAAKCVRCHGPETAESGLRLDERQAALAKLESGNRAIVPGQSDES